MTETTENVDSQPKKSGCNRNSTSVTVLLADDNRDLRESFSEWLTDQTEWRVHQAADGREALAKLDETIDIAVLDRDMPHLSGDDVVSRLAETTFSGPVVILSASRPDGSLNDGTVAAYLRKPLSPKSLVSHLESHL